MNNLLLKRCALVLLATGPMLAGCGTEQPVLQQHAEEQTLQIETLETSLSEARVSHAKEIEALRTELTEVHQRELDDLGSTLRRQVNEHSRTIAGLRKELAAKPEPPPPSDSSLNTSPPVAIPPVAPTPTISVYTPPKTDRSNFLKPPSGPDADLFPIRIESVKGEQIVIGTHTTSRMVDSGKVVKDKFGDEKPMMIPEPIEIENYDHQVTFTAENLTRNPVTIAFRAGRDRKTVSIGSGATVECKVPSLVGASLSVRANGDSRSFRVSYL